MSYKSIARFVRYSPYKLRPIADVVRGKAVDDALNWLAVHVNKRVVPVKKVIESAAANAKQLDNCQVSELLIKDIRIDEGPFYRYFKPGAMGRAQTQRRRLSHVQVILEKVQSTANKEV
jgi:large subunit ribosomal protein L22